MRPTNRGLTLLEALFAMTIAAVLAAFAIPAWSDARATVLMAQVRSQLAASLTEAVRYSALAGSEVVVCPRSDTGCAGTVSWDGGWEVFADPNGNRSRDAGETRLAGAESLPEGIHLRSTVGRTLLVFQPSGGNAGSNVTFTLCDRRGASGAVALVLSNNGRLRSGEPSASAARNCANGG